MITHAPCRLKADSYQHSAFSFELRLLSLLSLLPLLLFLSTQYSALLYSRSATLLGCVN